jgi:uncharacterized protein
LPDSNTGPLNFRLVDVVEPAAPNGLPLVPFFLLHDSRYQMYWEITTASEFAAHRESLAASEREKVILEAATLDSVAIGEQQPEVEHDFKGESTQTGVHAGRRWRDGQWFQYTLNTRGEKAPVLVVTYWGGDGDRSFEILVNAKLIATEKLVREKPGQFIERRYPLLPEVLAAAKDGSVTVKFLEKVKVAGGVFDVRLMRP